MKIFKWFKKKRIYLTKEEITYLYEHQLKHDYVDYMNPELTRIIQKIARIANDMVG